MEMRNRIMLFVKQRINITRSIVRSMLWCALRVRSILMCVFSLEFKIASPMSANLEIFKFAMVTRTKHKWKIDAWIIGLTDNRINLN